MNLDNDLKKAIDDLKNEMNIVGLTDTRLIDLIKMKFGDEKISLLLENKSLLVDLSNRFSLVAPLYVYNFIEKLIKHFSPKSILDPYLFVSSPILYSQKGPINGYSINRNQLEIIKALFPERTEELILGNPIIEDPLLGNKYDLILSFPPFGFKIHRNKDDYNHPLDFSTYVLLESAKLLKKNSKLLFLVPNLYFMDNRIINILDKSGLYFEAVFSLPIGAFSPTTNLSLNLIIISNEPPKKSFVAQITQDEKSNEAIFSNYITQKEGQIIQLGSYVEIAEFKSFFSYSINKEIQEYFDKIGYPPIPLIDITKSIIALKGDDEEHLPNSIYLPKIGNSSVVTEISDLRIKPKNYYQIQFNEQKANAIYIANFFNSPIGMKIRQSLESGSIIPQILKSNLKQGILYLPELNVQTEIIGVDNKIQEFELRLNDLKRKLWKYPKSYKKVEHELTLINQEENLEKWIDQIPFPISSILWRYYSTKNNNRKIEHLFHFFEAFSEFYSMLILSALVQDKEFYQEECSQWNQSEEEFKDWYLKSTFGSWNVLSANLSKAIRRFIQDKNKRDICISLLGNPSETFLSMISSKSIINILDEVCNLRNQWKGHSGISGEEENKRRVSTLEQKLNIFRKNISDAFEDLRILSPTTSSYEDGVYLYNAKELVGARTPLREITIKSLIPLDRKKLYLSNLGQNKPVELLPFIRFIESSCAIYFYTSIQSKSVRWVSYHFEEKSEIRQEANEELFKVFELLTS